MTAVRLFIGTDWAWSNSLLGTAWKVCRGLSTLFGVLDGRHCSPGILGAGEQCKVRQSQGTPVWVEFGASQS